MAKNKDPSKNVRDNLTTEIRHINDVIRLGVDNINSTLKGEINRIDEKIKLQTESNILLNVAEAKRIDAIRVVDVNAVAVANEKSAQQAIVLANQVAQSAETLRKLVETTAGTVAAQLQQISTQFTERLSVLERSQYENKGKQSYSDPMLADLMTEMKKSNARSSSNDGKSIGVAQVIGWIFGGVMLLVAVITLITHSK